jgi:hypothetical protein
VSVFVISFCSSSSINSIAHPGAPSTTALQHNSCTGLCQIIMVLLHLCDFQTGRWSGVGGGQVCLNTSDCSTHTHTHTHTHTNGECSTHTTTTSLFACCRVVVRFVRRSCHSLSPRATAGCQAAVWCQRTQQCC